MPWTTRKEHEMNRSPLRPFSGALAACALSAATLITPFAAPAHAQPGAGYYRAELAAPLAEPRQEILSGVVWNCEASTCTGTKSGSRAVIVCGKLAQEFGQVASFADAKGALDAESLARCNKG
jgi:hypothetical protein